MSLTTAQLIEQAKPRTLTVSVCSRGDLVDAHDAATSELVSHRSSDSGSLAGGADASIAVIAQRITDVEAEMEASTIQFTVQSIGRKAWADLKLEHPPTPDQRKMGLDNNIRSFPQAAIARCCVEPAVSPAESEQLAEILPEGEWNKLWSAVLGVNLGVMDTPKSEAAAAILRLNAS